MIYWDTSCALKLYTCESDSLRWQQQATGTADALLSSALLDVEMACALEQKESRGDLKPGGAQALLSIFRADVLAGRFVLCPVGTDVLTRATETAARCCHATQPVALRTLDALHLATAQLLKCSQLATTDLRMAAAAPLVGLRVLHGV